MASHHGHCSEQPKHPQEAQKSQESEGSKEWEDSQNINEVLAKKTFLSAAGHKPYQQFKNEEASDHVSEEHHFFIEWMDIGESDFDDQQNDGKHDKEKHEKIEHRGCYELSCFLRNVGHLAKFRWA